MQAPTRTKPPGWALLDANVLVYADDVTAPHHQASHHLRELGEHGQIALCLTPQVLNEYFAVITRPSKVSNPLAAGDACGKIEKFYASTAIAKIYPTLGVGVRHVALIKKYPVTGLDVYDLYLAATMLESGVTRIYTYDPGVFGRMNEIQVLIPEPPSSGEDPPP